MQKMITSMRLAWGNGVKYLPLLKNLIARELKKKYRTSVLGYAWCVFSPLFTMLIMTMVFSRMFHNSISNFPVYLFCGRMMYTFIVGGAATIMRAFLTNGGLMRKTRIPYYMFPLANFASVFVDLLFSFIAFAIVLLFTWTPVSIHVIALPAVLVQASMFLMGLGLLLAIANVYIRDIGHLYNVFTVAWMYLTPLFYPLESLSEGMQIFISTVNPLYDYIVQMRDIFLNNTWPTPVHFIRGLVFGAVVLAAGLLAYQKSKDTLILYV